ncbi:MAG: L-fucose/L-arabinose isomerase family protein [Clostridia bacterium]|nr:L-fucose/L-arabinose isomerase family protein [Clostridia bacterium]
MKKIKLAYCPTRRDVFSREEAMRFSKIIRAKLEEFPVDVVDLEGINAEKLLYDDADIPVIIDRFLNEKVDALFIPHCNFGSENRVAQVAKALGVPVLLWGPRDDFPDENNIRSRDSQCGIFATGKVLRRHNVPFTYLTNSWVDSDNFKTGVEKFIRVANVVKALKNLNILQISTRPEPFCSVICNENELLENFNIHLYPITINDLILKMDEILRTEPKDFKDTVELIKEIGTDGNEEKIRKVASLKVAMKELAKKYNCRAVAIQCWTSLQDMADIMPCFANSLLTDEGIPVVCETDIHGAISAIIMQAVSLEASTPFFADVTVRHPENDNAELLWHCGNFPYSLVKDKKKASVTYSKYQNNTYGIGDWELKSGELTIARFDGDHGKYSLLIGEAKTTDGPKNRGGYVWIEVDDWPKWERKIVEGPYIHHVSGTYGKYAEILVEACKYINVCADSLLPSEEIEARWR